MVRVVALDHIVLRSPDIERSLAFYCNVMGLEPVRVTEWREAKAPFPSVRIAPETLIDLVPLQEEPGNGQCLDHFCLVIQGPLDPVEDSLREAGYEVMDRGRRFGAQGMADSIYIVGPEGVSIEIRRYRSED